MNAVELALVGAIAYLFPSLRHAFRDHVEAFDDVLPHVFMADVCRWAVRTAVDDPLNRELIRVLDFLNAALTHEGELFDELIAASFLENLPKATDADAAIRELLPGGLSARLGEMEGKR